MQLAAKRPPKQDPKRIASAALQAFFNLCDRWQLSSADQRTLLGAPPESTFFKWKAEKSTSRLSHDVLERISYLLGIYKDLNILLPSPRAADEWIHKPNHAPLFNGQTALQRMLAGSIVDLADRRRWIDGQKEIVEFEDSVPIRVLERGGQGVACGNRRLKMVRRKVGYLSQEPNLNENHTIT